MVMNVTGRCYRPACGTTWYYVMCGLVSQVVCRLQSVGVGYGVLHCVRARVCSAAPEGQGAGSSEGHFRTERALFWTERVLCNEKALF